MDGEVWLSLTEAWHRETGPFDDMAVYERTQASRTGFAALLLMAGRPVGFVKARSRDESPLKNELAALDSLNTHRPDGFTVPRAMAAGRIDEWHYLLTSAIKPDLHRPPVKPPLEALLQDIRLGLTDLPRPSTTPRFWEPMHGDFTPWNLREKRNRDLVLFDWEDAEWAPPGADKVYYRAVERVLRKAVAVPQLDEARAFWIERLNARHLRAVASGDSDSDFTARVASELVG